MCWRAPRSASPAPSPPGTWWADAGGRLPGRALATGFGARNTPTVLFLCVANAARSQMAEALARQLAPAGYRFLSAGSEPSSVHPLAIAALAELGIDISHQRAKGLSEIALDEVDTVVTLCAETVCPVVPGLLRRLHWPLADPVQARGSYAARLGAFRATRDQLAALLSELWRQP